MIPIISIILITLMILMIDNATIIFDGPTLNKIYIIPLKLFHVASHQHLPTPTLLPQSIQLQTTVLER